MSGVSLLRPGTLLGLVVLGLVLAGMFWARGSGPVDTAASDVTWADGAVEVGDVRVVLSVTPRPPIALERMLARVRIEPTSRPAEAGAARVAALTLDDGRVSFEMTMPMGDHDYALVSAHDGWYKAEVVLPTCPSGGSRWYATVRGTVGGRPLTARFRLEMTKPAPPSTHPPAP